MGLERGFGAGFWSLGASWALGGQSPEHPSWLLPCRASALSAWEPFMALASSEMAQLVLAVGFVLSMPRTP